MFSRFYSVFYFDFFSIFGQVDQFFAVTDECRESSGVSTKYSGLEMASALCSCVPRWGLGDFFKEDFAFTALKHQDAHTQSPIACGTEKIFNTTWTQIAKSFMDWRFISLQFWEGEQMPGASHAPKGLTLLHTSKISFTPFRDNCPYPLENHSSAYFHLQKAQSFHS